MIRKNLFVFVVALSYFVAAGLTSGICQNLGPPIFFKMNVRSVEEMSNIAFDHLANAMSGIIQALNSGRKTGITINPDIAKQTLVEFQLAREGLLAVSEKIAARPIDFDTIAKSPFARSYERLVSSLKQSGLVPPVDGKTYIFLYITIIDQSAKDMKVLMVIPKGPGDLERMRNAFIDLIEQKMLLEQLATNSEIITIAMQ